MWRYYFQEVEKQEDQKDERNRTTEAETRDPSVTGEGGGAKMAHYRQCCTEAQYQIN